jgi:hypothetical protein
MMTGKGRPAILTLALDRQIMPAQKDKEFIPAKMRRYPVNIFPQHPVQLLTAQTGLKTTLAMYQIQYHGF